MEHRACVLVLFVKLRYLADKAPGVYPHSYFPAFLKFLESPGLW